MQIQIHPKNKTMFCKKISYKKIIKKLDAAIIFYLPIIARVVLNFKLAVGGTVAATLVEIIPGNIDDETRKKLLLAMERALLEFSGVLNNLNADGSINMHILFEQLVKMTKADRDSFWIKLSGLLLKYMHDGKLQQSEYDFFAQGNYTISKV